ncbi:unnamed protein product [Symbiodinium pilosum]|uniref:Uncharacterized protein n=1 Tax=Symbiodinium pilosum TaxID=2952 RepID=A0A812XA50_SYMPI|nr:unnamed protein product [Symbiodinium pilosum]
MAEDGPSRFRGAGVAINRSFEARMKKLEITGQRCPQAKPPNPHALKNRPSLHLDEAEIPNPTADQVVVIQPWFNLLAAAVWPDSSMQGSRDEVSHWSQSLSHELSGLRTPRTISRCLPQTPGESRLDSASTETRPPSSQAPMLPRPKRPERAEGALEATVWPAGSARWRRLERLDLVKPHTSPGQLESASDAQNARRDVPRSSDAFLGPVDLESDGESEPAKCSNSKPRSAGSVRCWWQL